MHPHENNVLSLTGKVLAMVVCVPGVRDVSAKLLGPFIKSEAEVIGLRKL